ncbi:MAG: alpha/beta fold hydrolase [Candidatus Thorarchaeota archaeon]
MFLDINGIRLNTVSFGCGKQTFLAHGGFVGSWELWQQPFELMSKRWHCVSYDHRGAGESHVPPESITKEAIVNDIFAVMDKLEIEKCILAGESMGGSIAIMAALQQPDRFSGLVLVDTGPPVLRPLTEETKQFIKLMETDFKTAMNRFVRGCINEPNSEHYIHWGLDICLRTKPEAAIRLARLFEGNNEGDTEYPLSNISVPTLVIHGSNDLMVPLDLAKYLKNNIPNAKLVVIDGAGHVPIMTYPYEVVEAIEQYFIP